MKITLLLTPDEVRNLVLDALGIRQELHKDVDFKIRKLAPSNEDMSILAEIQAAILHMVYDATRKIEAIKAVRTVFYNRNRQCGLYEAKWIVENFNTFVDESRAAKKLIPVR